MRKNRDEKKRKKGRKGVLEDNNLVGFCFVYAIEEKFSVIPMMRAQSIMCFLILE